MLRSDTGGAHICDALTIIAEQENALAELRETIAALQTEIAQLKSR